MFKYKSPLSRLLEGAGKSKDEDNADTEVAETEQPERPAPIADFNALRQALGGGDTTSESYEEADELIPEEKMPEFVEGEEAEIQEDQADAPVEDNDESSEQVVTLRLNQAVSTDTEESAATEDDMLAAVAEATTESVEPVDLTPAETVVDEAPNSEPTLDTAPEAVIEPSPGPAAIAPEQSEPTPATDRRARVKTTFLGFERADTHVQEMIETAAPVAKVEAAQQTFPVGWLVVTAGPGRGACVTLTEGLMQIGRNDDQAIQLDFGDTGISRSSHAVVAYDPEDRKCYLGHGGKANLVRLNGKPVLSTVPLANGDMIRISETTIRFTAFCDDGFDWRDAD